MSSVAASIGVQRLGQDIQSLASVANQQNARRRERIDREILLQADNEILALSNSAHEKHDMDPAGYNRFVQEGASRIAATMPRHLRNRVRLAGESAAIRGRYEETIELRDTQRNVFRTEEFNRVTSEINAMDRDARAQNREAEFAGALPAYVAQWIETLPLHDRAQAWASVGSWSQSVIQSALTEADNDRWGRISAGQESQVRDINAGLAERVGGNENLYHLTDDMVMEGYAYALSDEGLARWAEENGATVDDTERHRLYLQGQRDMLREDTRQTRAQIQNNIQRGSFSYRESVRYGQMFAGFADEVAAMGISNNPEAIVNLLSGRRQNIIDVADDRGWSPEQLQLSLDAYDEQAQNVVNEYLARYDANGRAQRSAAYAAESDRYASDIAFPPSGQPRTHVYSNRVEGIVSAYESGTIDHETMQNDIRASTINFAINEGGSEAVRQLFGAINDGTFQVDMITRYRQGNDQLIRLPIEYDENGTPIIDEQTGNLVFTQEFLNGSDGGVSFNANLRDIVTNFAALNPLSDDLREQYGIADLGALTPGEQAQFASGVFQAMNNQLQRLGGTYNDIIAEESMFARLETGRTITPDHVVAMSRAFGLENADDILGAENPQAELERALQLFERAGYPSLALTAIMNDRGVIQSGPENAAVALRLWSSSVYNMDPIYAQRLYESAGMDKTDIAQMRQAVITEGMHPFASAATEEQLATRYEAVREAYNRSGFDGAISRGESRMVDAVNQRVDADIQTMASEALFSRNFRNMWVDRGAVAMHGGGQAWAMVDGRPEITPDTFPPEFYDQYAMVAENVARNMGYASVDQIDAAAMDIMARDLGWRAMNVNGQTILTRNPIQALPPGERADAMEWASLEFEDIMQDDVNGALSRYRGHSFEELLREHRIGLVNTAMPGETDNYVMRFRLRDGGYTEFEIGARPDDAIRWAERNYASDIQDIANEEGVSSLEARRRFLERSQLLTTGGGRVITEPVVAPRRLVAGEMARFGGSSQAGRGFMAWLGATGYDVGIGIAGLASYGPDQLLNLSANNYRADMQSMGYDPNNFPLKDRNYTTVRALADTMSALFDGNQDWVAANRMLHAEMQYMGSQEQFLNRFETTRPTNGSDQ